MNIVLFDPDEARGNLLPLTYTRPVAEIRIGMETLGQRWQAFLPGEYSWETATYLRAKYPHHAAADTLRIAANVVADAALAHAVSILQGGEALYCRERLIAVRGTEGKRMEYDGDIMAIDHLWDIFMLNDAVLRADFARITPNLPRRSPSETVTVIGDPENLFIHADAAPVEGCIINVARGPVFIDRDAEVMEGACLRGPIAVGAGSVIKMGAKIYGATTLGPGCKIGGEVNNSVIFGFSNKAHDGFLGNAVVGEWCNMGAGFVASNLKNDYSEIKLWNYPAHRFLRTGLQFCGVIMGDHTKAGINTMLNTATVLGVGVNIHGSGFPRPFLASFLEGSTAGFAEVPMAKFFQTARIVMARRGIELTQTDIDILTDIREQAEQYR
ncbi:MAG: putative sugar nucleotidyl transferase [Bacteroidales bacterium]|nr:putative sugar nucleotidyl transferase [Bacteroidales bacterium]